MSAPRSPRGGGSGPPLTVVGGNPGSRPGGTRGRRWPLIAGAVVLFALVLVPTAARRLSDWLWFRELGFERVFLTKVAAQWTLGLLAAVITFALLYASTRAALARAPRNVVLLEAMREGPAGRAAYFLRLAGVAALPATAFLTLLLALGAAGWWRTALAFVYRQPFGVADPVFGRDVGYYVFTLPLIDELLGVAVAAVVLALVLAALVYAAAGELGRRGTRVNVGSDAAPHLALLGALLLLLWAARVHLVAIPSLLLSRHVPLFGASATDLRATLPALRAWSVLLVLAALLLVWRGWRGPLPRRASRAVLAGLGAAALLTFVVPPIYQRFVVQPNELAQEAPQIVHHLLATRRAWGIDAVQRRELDGETRLTARDIAANRATIANVRLWDREPLLQTFGQIQSIRTYYDFVSVDDDRYQVDGELRQVMLSARELNSAALPTRTFINEHLTYTHGMGVTLGPSNQVTAEGLPVLFIKDLPPVSTTASLRVARPQIYFGELAGPYVLAPTRQREFDYPAGEGGDAAVYSSYAGRGGVPVASFARRILFAVRFASINIVLSRDFTPGTRILYHRNVHERAERALPFLRFDGDPYLVVTPDGRLVWILDAYTTSDRYPYAQPVSDGTNYMRNSVKVTIDAYDGDVRAYLADPADPVARMLASAYPGLLRPIADLPTELRAHLRYPTDLFRVQTALFATFHMNDPETFYHREDQWQIPGGGAGEGGEAFVRHIVMRLPGESAPEFLLMRPFTPRQKDNLAAWMVARNDGDRYGELVVYRFPRQSLVFGPTQVVNRINQDTEVARQISLWDQRGSEVIRGELLVIPIEQSLIYVQPIYLRAQGGRIPELKRVVVVYEGRVAMEETLETGLARLFGGAAPRPPETVTASTPADSAAPPTGAATPSAALLREAVEHYDRARAAQRADDWATYGAEMRRL
ncbi:MAG TPA: UPF0182 family protein, partial [Gemmatimonadaceae bacterium]|nr:UPF0182 family protein [Gemmatimonadaceae bacterium]